MCVGRYETSTARLIGPNGVTTDPGPAPSAAVRQASACATIIPASGSAARSPNAASARSLAAARLCGVPSP